jgi:hypothetical protein
MKDCESCRFWDWIEAPGNSGICINAHSVNSQQVVRHYDVCNKFKELMPIDDTEDWEDEGADQIEDE